jgi:hypothetical protein
MRLQIASALPGTQFKVIKNAQIENFYLKILEESFTAVLGYPQIRLVFEHEYRTGVIVLRADSRESSRWMVGAEFKGIDQKE